MKRLGARLLLLVLAMAAASGLAEVLWRCVRPAAGAEHMYFRDDARRAFNLDAPLDFVGNAADREFLLRIEVPWPSPVWPAGMTTTPRPRASEEWFGEGYTMPRPSLIGNTTWRPGAHFFICYTGPRQDYFDADGCVEYRFNRFGIRDRD